MKLWMMQLDGVFTGFPQRYIINLLQIVIDFKVREIVVEREFQAPILLGRVDMNLVRFTNFIFFETLLPTAVGSNRLWIVNMKMVGSSTYFIDMFHSCLWMGFIVSFLLIGLLSTLGIYLLRRFNNERFDYLTWFSMITNQGGQYRSRLIFPKILLIILSILAIMFHGSFEAFLSSYLAIRNPDLPFTNLDGLLKSSGYSICIPVAAQLYYVVANLLNKSVGFHHRLNDHRCPENFKQFEGNLQNFQITNYCPMPKTVFFIPTNLEILNGNCLAYTILPLREKYYLQYDTFMVSPGFKYREQFNRGLIRLRTAGFIKKAELILQNDNENIDNKLNQILVDSSNAPIDFHQTQIGLLIPFVGILFGFIIFLIEWLIHY